MSSIVAASTFHRPGQNTVGSPVEIVLVRDVSWRRAADYLVFTKSGLVPATEGFARDLFTGNEHYGISALDGLPCERES